MTNDFEVMPVGTKARIERLEAEVERLRAQQAEPDAYGYASRLAVAIWEKHYKDSAPDWTPFSDLMLLLTQIDNMTAGLIRQPQQAEPLVRQWRSMTIQEINDLPEVGGVWWDFGVRDAVLRAIRAVDAKLREKNT